MNKQSQDELLTIIHKMKEMGLETKHIRDIEVELKVLKEPWLARVKASLFKHWRLLVGEYQETEDLANLINKGIREELSKEERIVVQAQILDFLKVIPASFFAALNVVLPIPGTSFLTPLILQKAGLLPSRWQEAHMLSMLQKEERKLRSEGFFMIASSIEELRTCIEMESDARQKHLSLLLHWDLNQNGQWDPEERRAYQEEVTKINTLAAKHCHKHSWYIMQSGFVFGPTSFSRLPKEDPNLLVRFDTKTKWVALCDLTDVEHLRNQSESTPSQLTPEADD